MTSRYIYEPLDLNKGQIRLLKLQPATNNKKDELEGTVQIFDYETLPPYQALSYKWGEPTDKFAIYIDGLPLAIRENLHDFLAVLARKGELIDQYIWVDQICIDQNSVHERNHQVALMSRIYSEAQRVLVWLGHHPSIVDVLEPLHASDFLYDALKVVLNDEKENGHYGPVRQMVDEVSSLPYWERLWIRQELMLARERIFIMSEKMTLTPEEIRDVLFFAKDRAYALGPFNMVLQFDESCQNFQDLALLLSMKSTCPDARDHVYGFQSVWPTGLRIPIDYAKPVADVLLDVCVKFWIFSYQNPTKLWIELDGGDRLNNLALCIVNLARSMGRINDDELDKALSLINRSMMMKWEQLVERRDNGLEGDIRDFLVWEMRSWPPPQPSRTHDWRHLIHLE